MVQLRRRPAGAFAAVAAAIALAPWIAAAQGTVVDLHGLSPRQVKSEAFSLASAQDLQIEAVGAESTNGWGQYTWIKSMWQGDQRKSPKLAWTGNAWILDLHSRKVVWVLSASSTESG